MKEKSIYANIRKLLINPGFLLPFFIIYIVIFMAVFFPEKAIPLFDKLTGKDKLRKDIENLEKRIIHYDEQISAAIYKNKLLPYISDPNFSLTWNNVAKENEVMRLFDYAFYALEKKDYDYAKDLFIETTLIEDTITARYYIGKIYYILGFLKEAFEEWERAIDLDTNHKYPEMLFFQAILAQELGENEMRDNYLLQYVRYISPPPPPQMKIKPGN